MCSKTFFKFVGILLVALMNALIPYIELFNPCFDAKMQITNNMEEFAYEYTGPKESKFVKTF